MVENYDDKFKDVMQYVTLHLKSRGSQSRIRNKEDLHNLIKWLDGQRKGGKNRISDSFISDILDTPSAARYAREHDILGWKGGTDVTVKTRDPSKGTLDEHKSEGVRYIRGDKGQIIVVMKGQKSGQYVRK